jgi:type I restriction enzyme S subunit
LSGGGKLKLSKSDYVSDGCVAYSAAGPDGFVATREFTQQAVVVSALGARCGKAFLALQPFTTLANTYVVFPKVEIANTKFIWYQLNDEHSWIRSGTAQPFIKPSDIKARKVILPSLAEQQRIVDILDRAAAIQRLRRAAEEKAREIIPALFVDMFGDPATNPKGWPVGTLAAAVDEFRYGTSVKSGATGVPVLRIPNVIGEALDTKEIKFVQLSPAELTRLTLADGDLLFVRTNGNPDYVGRSAIYSDKQMVDAGYAPNASVYASYLIRARLNRSVCPAFIQAQLSSAEGRRYFRERSRTSAGQYNINTESLGTIPLMLPPLSLQLAFAEKTKAIANIFPTANLAKQTSHGVVSALAASLLG